MLYNCGRIFLISFFVGCILSFGLVRLRTNRLSARAGAGAHIERRCSRSSGEDETLTDVIIKTLDRKWDWGCEWCHAWKRWAEDFGWFLKKKASWFFWTWARPVQWGLRDALRIVGSDGTVSIVKIVSLSPHVENLKVKKVIKVLYLNYRESSVFRDSYAGKHFTYSYFEYITPSGEISRNIFVVIYAHTGGELSAMIMIVGNGTSY